MAQAAADALQERLVLFAVKIIGLVTCLPKTTAGRHVAGQVLRSGTSPAPNYAEARGAESRADFVHKLRIAVKELNETGIWLLIILTRTSRNQTGKILCQILLCRIIGLNPQCGRS